MNVRPDVNGTPGQFSRRHMLNQTGMSEATFVNVLWLYYIDVLDEWSTALAFLVWPYFLRCTHKTKLIHTNMKFVMVMTSAFFNLSAASRLLLRRGGFARDSAAALLLNVANVGSTGCLNLMIVTLLCERVLATVFARSYERRGARFAAALGLLYAAYFGAYCALLFGLERAAAEAAEAAAEGGPPVMLAVPDEPCLLYRRPLPLILTWCAYPAVTAPVIPLMYGLVRFNERQMASGAWQDLGLRFQYRQNVSALRHSWRVCLLLAAVCAAGNLCALLLLYKFVVRRERHLTVTAVALMNIPSVVLNVTNVVQMVIWLLHFQPLYQIVRNDYLTLVCGSDDKADARAAVYQSSKVGGSQLDAHFTHLMQAWNAADVNQ